MGSQRVETTKWLTLFTLVSMLSPILQERKLRPKELNHFKSHQACRDNSNLSILTPVVSICLRYIFLYFERMIKNSKIPEDGGYFPSTSSKRHKDNPWRTEWGRCERQSSSVLPRWMAFRLLKAWTNRIFKRHLHYHFKLRPFSPNHTCPHLHFQFILK